MKTILLILTQFFLISVCAQKTYYVSTTGSDTNSGLSETAAFATPNKAVSVAVAGDLIWVKGGTYMITTTIKPAKAGTSALPIRMWARTGEKPVFNCQPLIDAGKTSNAGRGMEITKDWWHIKGVTVCNTNDRGITISGKNVTLEGVTVYRANNDGIAFMSTCTNALVLNCDSYLNWERGKDGNNGDGFAAKAGATGNVFRGCRAWNNADDGWDVYGGANPVLIDSCWSFNNGYNVFGYTGTWKGNGNGYKLGGTSVNAEHTVTNSLAFCNASKGFDQNHATMGQTIVNCTGYNNRGANGNFSFYETPTAGTLRHHVLKNNLSYKGLTHYLDATAVQVTNSWNLPIAITDNDFVSLDTSLALLPRTQSYRLQNAGFLRLKSGSTAIDAGTNVGKPFIGRAPDLGAFEYTGSTLASGLQSDANILVPYQISAENPQNASMSIYNLRGLLLKKTSCGDLTCTDLKNLPAGLYILIINKDGKTERIKYMKQ